MADDKKPGLAILIGHALKQKGKAKKDPMADEEMEGPEDESHLEDLADQILDAIEAKDAKGLKELLAEFVENC